VNCIFNVRYTKWEGDHFRRFCEGFGFMKHAAASRQQVYISEPKYPLGTTAPSPFAEGVRPKPVTTFSDAYLTVILQSTHELRRI
jgi:hypothetical protein